MKHNLKAPPANAGIAMDATQRMNWDQLINFLPGQRKKSTIYKWVHLGKIPYHKIKSTGTVFFIRSEIEAWMMGKEISNE